MLFELFDQTFGCDGWFGCVQTAAAANASRGAPLAERAPVDHDSFGVVGLTLPKIPCVLRSEPQAE